MTDAEGVRSDSGSDDGVAGTLSPEASADALDARELYEQGLLSHDDDFLSDWSPTDGSGGADDADRGTAADDRPVGSVTIIEQGKSERSSLPPVVLGAVVLVPMALVLTIVAYVFAGDLSAYVVGGLFGALLVTVLGIRLRRSRSGDAADTPN